MVDSNNIAQAAIDHFSNLFSQPDVCSYMSILRYLEDRVIDQHNDMLQECPSEEEIKLAVFSMDPNSSARPDGFNGHFFQSSWDVIKVDLMAFLRAFFTGANLTRYYTHAFLVLISKVKVQTNFSQLKPISLCNFTNKILSKIIAMRLAHILPTVVSQNQIGFVKGRIITENILLAQEIVHGIKGGKEGGNIVLKLDMSKAYDKISWTFLTLVRRMLSFKEYFIELIHRIISNNWYSIIVNGTMHGFFRSSRGLKQGDPLSPALFIIAAEALSKSLNHLHSNNNFKDFNMNANGPQINHLCYADDLVLFSSIMILIQELTEGLRSGLAMSNLTFFSPTWAVLSTQAEK